MFSTFRDVLYLILFTFASLTRSLRSSGYRIQYRFDRQASEYSNMANTGNKKKLLRPTPSKTARLLSRCWYLEDAFSHFCTQHIKQVSEFEHLSDRNRIWRARPRISAGLHEHTYDIIFTLEHGARDCCLPLIV